MNKVTIDTEGDDIKIYMEITSDMPAVDSYSSHLLTEAIVYLIEGADTGLWGKNEEELQPDEFYAQLFAAIARHYAVDDPMGRTLPVHEWIEMLIEQLRYNGYLMEGVKGVE